MKRQSGDTEVWDWVSALGILTILIIIGAVGWSGLHSLTTAHPPNYFVAVGEAEERAQHRWNIRTTEANGGQRWLTLVRATDEGEPWELNWPPDHPDYRVIAKLPACSQLTFTAQRESCRPCPVGLIDRLLGTRLPNAELTDYLRVKMFRPPETKEGAS